MSDARASRTFQQASQEIKNNLERHLSRQQTTASNQESISSSEESDDDLAYTNGQDDRNELLDKVFQGYSNLKGAEDTTREAILSTVKSGRSSCLICISSIKKQDAIWNCSNCYCSIHINCIQRWAKDSIFQQKNDAEQREREDPRFNRPALSWACPKCRHAYSQSEIPTRYYCFCGRVTEPEFDPWGVPHSCGNICGRSLKPECGHACLILCHPGPCPPCPKMVTSPCFCVQSAPSMKRCFNKLWSCGKPCGKLLNCGQHPCPKPCHKGECEPCSKTSVQLCSCRRHQQEMPCASPDWQCTEKCGKPLKCSHHICDVVCHKGTCPPCPLSGVRRCPCGKSTHVLPCTLATPTCGDTCGKPLKCPGNHVCPERCHRGACGSCLQMEVKRCRCGAKKKEVACTKDYVCDVKCRRLRDCRKHTCNRKCCDGTACPPCEQSCNKTLTCKNHKCASRCHPSYCYPCTEMKEISCACGQMHYLVPCGREKDAKPPKCRNECKQPTNCHHPSREKHYCHFGSCPTCKQICGKDMKCGHKCKSSCHEEVKVKVGATKKAAVPWEEQGPRVEIRSVSCPECPEPVLVTCPGEHETASWPCHAAKSAPCGRVCGRNLKCGNHQCQRDCHKVKKAPNDTDAGINCRKCELECQVPRPSGCSHPCSIGHCHPGECPPCSQMTRIYCHCGLSQLYVKCFQRDDEGQACCQNQCPKLMECGHRCSKVCHQGPCSDSAACKKRSKVYCPCKRKKEEIRCSQRAQNEAENQLACDEDCKKAKEKVKVDKEDRQDAFLKEQARRLEREELERFEKSLEGKKRRRQRHRHSETVQLTFMEKHRGKVIVLSLLAAVFSIGWFVVFAKQ